MEKSTVSDYRWSEESGDTRCIAVKDGLRCLNVTGHPPTLDPTGHDFGGVGDSSNIVPFPGATAEDAAPAADVAASVERVHTDTPDDAVFTEPAPVPWICTNCGTENPPAPADALVEKCTKCDEPSPAMKARIDAALTGHNLGVGTAEEVEQTARQQEGVSGAAASTSAGKPVDRPLPLRGTTSSGRFDAVDAWERLEELRDNVIFCQRDHDADVKRAKASGQRLKDAEDDYFKMFDAFREQREKAAHQPDMFSEQQRRDELASSECEIERQTGAPCPACQSQRAKGKPAKPGDPLHPAHVQHAEVAKALLIKDLEELRARLIKKHLHLTIAEIQDLSVADLQVLQRYGAQRGRIPDEKAAVLIARAHVAAEAGTERQECRQCGEVLLDRAALDDGKPFEALSIVGPFTCAGDKAAAVDTPPVPAPPAAEESEVRTPKSHAKKDKRKKVEPEHHATAQKAEGAKRVKTAEKKAAKKPLKLMTKKMMKKR